MQFVIVIVMLFFGSCRSITGDYVHDINKSGVESVTLSLKKDSTFIFKGWSDITGLEVIEGKWSIIEDTVFLSKEVEITGSKSIFLEAVNKSLNKEKKIIVMDYQDSSQIVGARVFINGADSEIFTDSQGEVILENNEAINKLRVKYLALDQEIVVKNGDADQFNVYLNLENIRIRSFKLFEKWLWNRKKITPLNNENKRLDEFSLRKR